MKRPDASVRPFLKAKPEQLEAGQLFYVRNEQGHGYRPRCFVGMHQNGTYEYQSYMNNDTFAACYEETHMDNQAVFLPKPFALKIMQRGKDLADEVAVVFTDIPMAEIQRENMIELFDRIDEGVIGYDEYEAIKQAVRRLGWQDASIVRRQGNNWMIDTEAFEYMINVLTGKAEQNAAVVSEEEYVSKTCDYQHDGGITTVTPSKPSLLSKVGNFLFGNNNKGDSCGV